MVRAARQTNLFCVQQIFHIFRDCNSLADGLANEVLDAFDPRRHHNYIVIDVNWTQTRHWHTSTTGIFRGTFPFHLTRRFCILTHLVVCFANICPVVAFCSWFTRCTILCVLTLFPNLVFFPHFPSHCVPHIFAIVCIGSIQIQWNWILLRFLT